MPRSISAGEAAAALDTPALRKAIAQPAEGLDEALAELGPELLGQGVIQRFELSYELLRRHLAQTDGSPGRLDAAGFADPGR